MAEHEADPETMPVEKIRHDEDVREELQKASPDARAARSDAGRVRWGSVILFGVASAAFAALMSALDAGAFPLPAGASDRLSRIALALALAALLLAVHGVLTNLVRIRIANKVARFNLLRVLRLAAAIAIVLAVVSVFFANWYTTAVSLGLVSLILGLALQAPITSFFAWIYILVNKPYRVGDRIRIGPASGDVIDLGYLDTTLWEFGGDLLSTDHPSGRIIKFPNSQIFTTPVFNYSWPLFPYVWNEIKLQVGYQSDLEFVSRTMIEVVEADRGPGMVERIHTYREILAETAVDHLQVQDRPTVLFRANEMSWLDAIVRYLVDPRRAGKVKTQLTRTLLARLNAEPERVLFPKGDSR